MALQALLGTRAGSEARNSAMAAISQDGRGGSARGCLSMSVRACRTPVHRPRSGKRPWSRLGSGGHATVHKAGRGVDFGPATVEWSVPRTSLRDYGGEVMT